MKRGSGFPNPKSHSRLIKFMEIKAVKAITEMVKTFPPPPKKKRERFRQFIGDKSRNCFPRKRGVLGLHVSSQRQTALCSFKMAYLYSLDCRAGPRGRHCRLDPVCNYLCEVGSKLGC